MRKWEGICWKRLGFLALTQPTCPTVALLDAVELCSCFRKVRCFYRPNERAALHQSHALEDTLRKHLHFRAFDLWQELYFHAYHTLGGWILTAAKMWGVEVKLGKTIKWETPRRVEWKAVQAGFCQDIQRMFEGFWWIFLALLCLEKDTPHWGGNE